MLIAVDHGNKLMKTIHHPPFTSGLEENEKPPFGGETLKYEGKYYTLSERHITYQLLSAVGPSHQRTFTVALVYCGETLASASGPSKKEAEQAAAKEAIGLMGYETD